MSRKIISVILILLFFAATVSADNTAPTTYSVGYKLWSKYWDFMGNTGAINGSMRNITIIDYVLYNGTIGGTGNNTIILPSNIATSTGNNVLQWNGTAWINLNLDGAKLYNNTLENVTVLNTTVLNATSIQGNGSGLHSLNASNATIGTLPSSVYGTGVYTQNVSNFNLTVTDLANRSGYVTNATMYNASTVILGGGGIIVTTNSANNYTISGDPFLYKMTIMELSGTIANTSILQFGGIWTFTGYDAVSYNYKNRVQSTSTGSSIMFAVFSPTSSNMTLNVLADSYASRGVLNVIVNNVQISAIDQAVPGTSLDNYIFTKSIALTAGSNAISLESANANFVSWQAIWITNP